MKFAVPDNDQTLLGCHTKEAVLAAVRSGKFSGQARLH